MDQPQLPPRSASRLIALDGWTSRRANELSHHVPHGDRLIVPIFDARAEARPGVRWPGTDLHREDLGGFDLHGSIFSGTRMPDITAADLSRSLLDGATISRARGACFRDAVLTGALMEFALLEGACFRHADLRSAILVGAGLRRADLTGADLTDADFGEADLSDVRPLAAHSLLGCNLDGAIGLSASQRRAAARRGAIVDTGVAPR